jgi:hypothetical protein
MGAAAEGFRRQALRREAQYPSFFLGDQSLGIALGRVNQAVPMLLYISGRATFDRHVVRNIDRVYHVDRIPWTNLSAVLTADAPIELDITPRLQARNVLAGNLVNAVDRTDFDARFTASATIGVNHRQDLGNHLAGLAGQGRCCHVTSSRVKIDRNPANRMDRGRIPISEQSKNAP